MKSLSNIPQKLQQPIPTSVTNVPLNQTPSFLLVPHLCVQPLKQMAHVFSSFHIPSLLLPCPPSAEMEAITVNQSEISTGLNHRLLPSLSSTLLSADSSTSQIKILTRHTLGNTCYKKNRFLSGIARKGGGRALPKFVGPFSTM